MSLSKILPIKPIRCLLLFAALTDGVPAWAEEEAATPEQSFRSCSLITSELLTAAQFNQQGLSMAQLKESLPVSNELAFNRIQQIYDAIKKDGIETTYRNLNVLYQQCAQDVYQRRGIPPRDTSEFGFYYCSGENKLRHQVLEAKASGLTLDGTLATIPSSRHPMAKDLFLLAEKTNLLQAYEHSASELKSCLNQVLGLAPQQ